MPRAVAIYARISQDRDGDMLGVRRQLDDCRAHAQARSWPVADEYVDDDVSAYNGKPRPEYRRMLADITNGRLDGVVVWHLDRLHRHPKELEEFFEVCAAARVRHLASVTGDVDLSTHDGQFLARILGAVARKESDDKSRRVKRKHLELAQAGRWVGRRPFGYDEQMRIVPEEAEIIREAARRLLAGESVRTITNDLIGRGIPTRRGAPWARSVLRGIVLSPRNVGLRALGGEVVATGQWEPILTAEQSARVRALLTDPARRLTRPARSYLLSGFLYCGLCGAKLVTRPDHGVRAHQCVSGPEYAGCGKLGIHAEPVEELVTEAVLYRLDTPALAEALAAAERVTADDGTDVIAAIADDDAQLAELAKAYAARDITMAEWLMARKAIEDRLRHVRATLARQDRPSALRRVVGQGGALRRQWADMNLDQRRAVVGTVLDRLIVQPAPKWGRVAVSPGERVDPVWKV